jgi:hypothetical protein
MFDARLGMALGLLLWLGNGGPASGRTEPVDAVALAKTLSRTGGAVDASGATVSQKLSKQLEFYQSQGRRVWVVRLPAETDLDATLERIAGALAPGQSDMVVVASPRGVRARVPALAGRTDLIDAAFAATRAELAADLDAGLVAFCDRLVTTADGQAFQARFLVGGFLACLLLTALLVTDRFRFFWRLKQRWASADRRSRQDLVDLVQKQLQTIAHRNTTGGRVFYDQAYARLERIREEPGDLSGPELAQLHQELEAWLSANPGGDAR